MNRVSVLNESKIVKQSDVQQMVDALKLQIQRDFEPIWGIGCDLQFAPGTPPPGTWWLVILDDAAQATVLGYHELTDEGLPLAKVFAKICQDQKLSWTVSASHELIEMLADPNINLSVLHSDDDRTQSFVAYEICDPCEADEFAYKVGEVLVSDFVFPSWFEAAHQPRIRQFDQCGKITAPFQCLRGGYLTSMALTPNAQWRQIDPLVPAGEASTPSRSSLFAIEATRRQRRRGHGNWLHSLRKVQPPASGHDFGLRLVNNGAELALIDSTGGIKSPIDELLKARSAIASRSVSTGSDLNNVVDAALAQIQKVGKLQHLTGDVPDEKEISLVLSALSNPAPTPNMTRAMDLVGVGGYEAIDLGWLESLGDRIITKKFTPFPNHIDRKINPVVEIPDKFKIALAGDWGTGNVSSINIKTQMQRVNPDCTIHLGDVYYAGSAQEQRNNFLTGNAKWPAGSYAAAPSFALNGNHEMYSGGTPYFNDVLAMTAQFSAQQGLSYFALSNKHWLILGLDTSYYAESYFYKKGDLGALQLSWMNQQMAQARSDNKHILLLTHHDGIDIGNDGKTATFQKPLWCQVTQSANGTVPDYWYWGHVHAGIIYSPIAVNGGAIKARCVGHGGVPYAPFGPAEGLGDPKVGVGVIWAESLKANDPKESRRALNGFVQVTLDGETISEKFVDENGNSRYPI